MKTLQLVETLRFAKELKLVSHPVVIKVDDVDTPFYLHFSNVVFISFLFLYFGLWACVLFLKNLLLTWPKFRHVNLHFVERTQSNPIYIYIYITSSINFKIFDFFSCSVNTECNLMSMLTGWGASFEWILTTTLQSKDES